MRIISVEDYGQLSKAAANMLTTQVILKRDSVLGLATGSTPLGTYERLIERYEQGELDFQHCRSVNLDEYVGLGEGDENSYHSFMQEHLFKKVNISMQNVNIPNGKNADAAAECRRYDDVLSQLGAIDIQLLGLGNNGHIAFNEPDDAFVADTHMVALSQETIEANKRFFVDVHQVPRFAYTMGLRSIMCARRVLLLVSGKGKADILCRSLTGTITPFVPASILQLHRDLTVIADEEALTTLRQEAGHLIGNYDGGELA